MECGQNFDECAHDIRKSCDSKQEDYCTANPFGVASWMVITKSNRTQWGKCKISTDNNIGGDIITL